MSYVVSYRGLGVEYVMLRVCVCVCVWVGGCGWVYVCSVVVSTSAVYCMCRHARVGVCCAVTHCGHFCGQIVASGGHAYWPVQ